METKEYLNLNQSEIILCLTKREKQTINKDDIYGEEKPGSKKVENKLPASLNILFKTKDNHYLNLDLNETQLTSIYQFLKENFESNKSDHDYQNVII